VLTYRKQPLICSVVIVLIKATHCYDNSNNNNNNNVFITIADRAAKDSQTICLTSAMQDSTYNRT